MTSKRMITIKGTVSINGQEYTGEFAVEEGVLAELNKPAKPKEVLRPLQPSWQIIQSLLNLRDELWNTRPDIYFKINSCLFSEYPHKQNENKTLG